MHDQLGWLSRGVTVTQRQGDDLYRLRTMSHPDLDRYWTWATEVPSDWVLTRRAAQPWYACDGAISFTGRNNDQRKMTFSATDGQFRESAISLLNEAGYDVGEWNRRIFLPKSQITNWLDWLGDPVPGVEHKWAKSPSEYNRR